MIIILWVVANSHCWSALQLRAACTPPPRGFALPPTRNSILRWSFGARNEDHSGDLGHQWPCHHDPPCGHHGDWQPHSQGVVLRGEGGETGNRGNLQTRSCSVPNFCTCVLSKLQWSLKYSVKVVEIASCVWVWETNTDQQKWMEGHWSKLTKSLSTSCASLTSQKPLPFSPEIQFCEAGYCRHKDQEN